MAAKTKKVADGSDTLIKTMEGLGEIKYNISGLFMCACVHMIYDLSEGHKLLQPSMGRNVYQY